MDWSRAKSILIAIMAVLNVALGVSIYTRGMSGAVGDRVYADVARILERRGVAMECEFPKGVRAIEILAYDTAASDAPAAARAFGQIPGGQVEAIGGEAFEYSCAAPQESLPMSSDAELDAALKELLAGLGMDMEEYELDRLERAADGGALAEYVQTFHGRKVFDGYARVSVNAGGGVTGASVAVRGVLGEAGGKSPTVAVAPAYQILLRHYGASGQAVELIEIGYMAAESQAEAAGSQSMESEGGAVWRIRLTDGSMRFFDAMYGDEIIREGG